MCWEVHRLGQRRCSVPVVAKKSFTLACCRLIRRDGLSLWTAAGHPRCRHRSGERKGAGRTSLFDLAELSGVDLAQPHDDVP
jgi:hypothetical protein